MSQNRIVARPYAKAAFEFAQEENDFAKWSDMLSFAATVASDKQVAQLMKNPKFSTAQLINLFLDLGKDLFSKGMQNFIQTLGTFKRLKYLPEIQELYEQLRAQAENVVNVELISAFPVDEKTKEKFTQALKRRLNSNISLHCTTDKAIMGGAIIRAGDLVIDGSIRGRLIKLSDTMGIS